MIALKPIPKNIKGKRVFLRVDFNMPFEGSKFTDDFRFARTLPTIKLLQKRGAKVILVSHIEYDGKYPSFKKFEKFFKKNIKNLSISKSIVGKNVIGKTNALPNGEVLLLENLRLDPREKRNNSVFAGELAGLADIYVNEAFSVSHRRHASIIGVSKHLPSYAGPLFADEVKNLARAFRPKRPFMLVLGGKKFSTKEPLLEKFIKKADHIFIGGGMAALLLHCRGHNADISDFTKKDILFCKKFKNSKKIIPILDVFIKKGNKKKTIGVEDISGEKVFDIGPKTVKSSSLKIKKSKLVLWNGPLGWIEGGFTDGTKNLARELTKSKAETIVGGGDTVAFLRGNKLISRFHFVSTGGGAMLEFLAKETLPGISTLEKEKLSLRRRTTKNS